MALAQDILKIFNDMQVPANGDQAAAITSFVASMQCLVTGTGTIAGALGTATTAPAA